MKNFLMIFAALATMTVASVAQADTVKFSHEALDMANALIRCPKEVAEVANADTIWATEGSAKQGKDVDTYEVVFSNIIPSPMSRPFGVSVLTITRTLESHNCPAQAMDCGGITMVYTCKLRTHVEAQDESKNCSKDFGKYGWPSNCICPEGQAYDSRVGSCF